MEKFQNRIPQWYKEVDSSYNTILTPDMDGLVSAMVTYRQTGAVPKFFYDCRRLWSTDGSMPTDKTIGIDIDLTHGKCIGNHVTALSSFDDYNSEAINLNLYKSITKDNYADKYAGSTALMVYRLFNCPLSDSEDGKMALLALDSGYKGFYTDRFREINQTFIGEVLDYPELVDIERNKSLQDFIAFQGEQSIVKFSLDCNHKLTSDKYGTHEETISFIKDVFRDGKETSKIFDISFPYLVQEFNNTCAHIYCEKKYTQINSNIYSLALTHSNFLNYSVPKEVA